MITERNAPVNMCYAFGMDDQETPRLPGRQAEAARNDERILEAARAVFLADTNAPIAAVAERAGVGIGALYRRYRSKEELLARLYVDNIRRLIAETEIALADDGDPWVAFCRYLHRSLDAGLGSLSVRFVGEFPLDDEMWRGFDVIEASDRRLLERARAAGVVREDITSADIVQFFHLVQRLYYDDAERSRELRHRYLSIFLVGIHASSAAMPLHGPPLRQDELDTFMEQKLQRGLSAKSIGR